MNTRIISVLLAAFAIPAPAAAVAQLLEGTLFTQPVERAYLDFLRNERQRNSPQSGFNVVDVPDIPTDEVAEADNSDPITHTFGGIMTRRDGSRSVWLDGRLMREIELPANFTLVASGPTTVLQIAHDGKTFLVRPGQVIDLGTGVITESARMAPEPAPAPEVVAESPVVEPAASAGQEAVVTEESSEDAATVPADFTGESGLENLADTLNGMTEEELDRLSLLRESRDAPAADQP